MSNEDPDLILEEALAIAKREAIKPFAKGPYILATMFLTNEQIDALVKNEWKLSITGFTIHAASNWTPTK